MTYTPEGLGKVAAVDSTLSGMDRTRFMSPNKGARMCAGYFVTSGTATSVKIRPVYVRQPDPGNGLTFANEPKYEDPSQEVTYTADGSFTAEFRNRPGFLIGFKVTTLTGGGGVAVDISGQHLWLGPA